MFKTELINASNSERRSVSFFEDDTIETVRQQIAKSSDIHHDRLYILIAVKCSRNYYQRDSRNWEALFNRLSLNGMPIERETFQAYLSSYRVPTLSIQYSKIDKDEWMTYPDSLRDIFEPHGEFTEYRIFGVENTKSYCLPLEFNSFLAARILPAQSPIPDNSKLFLSLYDTKEVKGFLVKAFESGAEGAYFPLLRATTPTRLTDDQVLKLENNSKHLQDLLSLDPPVPSTTHILRSTWFVDLVDTDFGAAIGTRFEQIFYGLTVSKEVPCITYFTGRTDVSRHKFYTEDAKNKRPFLEIPVWNAWWTKSKPPRNRPTLILYRGSDRENYDRVSISSSDISFAIYRSNSNTKSIDELQDELRTWFLSFDAITAFIESSDIASCRWSLQDIKFEAKYSESIEELDTRRMNCISAIFDESRKDKQVFRFLRTDYANDGITPTDLRILDLLRDSPFLKSSELEEELKVTPQEASRLLQNITLRIEEDPGLMNRKFRGFPIVMIKSKSIEVSTVTDVDRPLRYVNLLRYLLTNPSSKDLDRICPKRIETVSANVAISNLEINVDDAFDDLFGYAESESVEEAPAKKRDQLTRITKKGTKYGYFQKRLEDFDPKTFDFSKSTYPKECEQSHQPTVLSEKELSEMIQEFNPRTYLPEDKIIETKDPNGIILCPDYWCMNDEIPLQESQLITIDSEKVCPICHGKVRKPTDSKSDFHEYSVLKRKSRYSFPGPTDVYSPNNQRNLPCCFKTARVKKIQTEEKDYKYYILDETKGVNPLRFAYLPLEIVSSLHISEDYSLIKKAQNRIQAGMSGFFRVGLGRASQTLPLLLKTNKPISSPKQNIEWILSCSFLATWRETSDTHVSEINESLKSFEAFKDNAVSREHVARLISSIDEAFHKGTLSAIQELEYTAIVLRTDIFRIDLDTQSVNCTFYTQQVRSRTKGVIILQRGSEIDCLCHVVRVQKRFEYRVNIFENPFKKETSEELIKLRRDACRLSTPTFAQAGVVLTKLFPEHLNDFSVILDPFGRGQAIYVENTIILPFQNSSLPPINQSKIQGYSNAIGLPEYERTKSFLEVAKTMYPGYEYEQDIHDGDNYKVEILTKSGLRIPVIPVRSIGENEEVLKTTSQEGETSLVFGNPNSEDAKTYKEISYAAEVYEFLIFQLTADIQNEEYRELQLAMREVRPKRSELEQPLRKWFDETTYFHSIDQPLEFLSKIRTPCGQFKNKNTCESGHMCGWNKNQCRIEVRDSLSKTKLFNKVFRTVLENSKIRSMILDNRTTPFFSTILYLELPTEIILTDYQLK